MRTAINPMGAIDMGKFAIDFSKAINFSNNVEITMPFDGWVIAVGNGTSNYGKIQFWINGQICWYWYNSSSNCAPSMIYPISKGDKFKFLADSGNLSFQKLIYAPCK